MALLFASRLRSGRSSLAAGQGKSYLRRPCGLALDDMDLARRGPFMLLVLLTVIATARASASPGLPPMFAFRKSRPTRSNQRHRRAPYPAWMREQRRVLSPRAWRRHMLLVGRAQDGIGGGGAGGWSQPITTRRSDAAGRRTDLPAVTGEVTGCGSPCVLLPIPAAYSAPFSGRMPIVSNVVVPSCTRRWRPPWSASSCGVRRRLTRPESSMGRRLAAAWGMRSRSGSNGSVAIAAGRPRIVRVQRKRTSHLARDSANPPPPGRRYKKTRIR